MFGDPVELKGPIHFENDQWAVTDYGLECKVTAYELPVGGLLLQHDTGGSAAMEHVCHKTWVDIDAFAEGLRMAIYHHHPRAMIPFDLQQAVEMLTAARDRPRLHNPDGNIGIAAATAFLGIPIP